MDRERAEKLLAAMIFDDLDEPSKAELLAYLRSDDDLRDRLADMRMAVKLACDAVNDGPDPVLSEHRLRKLKRLARTGKPRMRLFAARPLLAVAAVLVVGLVLTCLLMPSLLAVKPQRGYVAVGDVTARLDGTAGAEPPTTGMPAPARARASRSDSGSASRYGGAGGMGGMGGYGGGMMGGMASEESRRHPVARSDSYYETSGERAVLNGQLEAKYTPSGPRGGRSVSSMDVMDRESEPLGQLGPASRPVDELSMSARGIDNRLETDRSQLRPTSEPTARETDGDSVGLGLSYGWSGSVTPGKPVKALSQTTPAESRPVSPRQPGVVLSDIPSLATTEARVPVLGDMPLVGGLLRSESEDKKNLSVEESHEARGRGEKAFLAPLDGPGLKGVEAWRNQAEGVALDEKGKEAIARDTTDQPSGSRFTVVPVNPWVMTDRDPLSTFALDVDTASYALCRRYIRSGFLPPVGAVRMEEFINAFDYAYPQREGATFAVYAEGAPSPFAPTGQDLTLLKIAVKARTVGRDQRRAAHIVFVVDASASMGQADRLPQVQAALNLLVDRLCEADRISLVTCADQARLHLEAVPARQKDTIRQTIDAIQPAGPTNLLAGLEVGYDMARRAFVAGRINQVVLCSDGVANVGRTEAQDVLEAVADDRRQGITLTCVGVGYGAYNDAFLETLADRGDGQYVFLDSSEQAREDLVGQLAATLQTVAKDARIQVQFNPHRVRRYRLVGYENRDIEDRRFRDDTVDAGEVGSGQCSTALYELELTALSPGEGDGELGTVFVRYRDAETGQVEEISRSLTCSLIRRRSIEEDPRFFLAAGAARFAEWLRQSEHARDMKLAGVQDVLDRVSAVLPLDRTVQDLAALAHQAENLPRASETTAQP